jgi:hypothetical protein
MTPELRKALFECASKDHPNKALHGVLFRDDYIIVSDSTQLVKVRKEFDFDSYVEAEDGSLINAEYPNIKHGIFLEGLLTPDKMVCFKDLKRAAELVPKSEDEPGKHIALDLFGKMLYPPILLRTLKVFEANKDTIIHVLVGEERIQIHGQDTCAVVMALTVKGNPTARCKEAYTVAQILAMEDLL